MRVLRCTRLALVDQSREPFRDNFVTLFFGHDDFLSRRQFDLALDDLALRFWHPEMGSLQPPAVLSTILSTRGKISALIERT